ncbi:YdcF family protein [Cyanobium sp. HWJ4-Hawea]|uniref:YdcF family protein n=1 Tax=Cyanobium sp. HWJ4-Hawea TaxID=2823713 RepID=UPI0020CF1405|nr:YdcF family protein [Cyanobium sp. HWJ4-Hawea]MCP9808605.1 YdcF family protein [Cyanobium sp. HWJ4-Hawea]
MGFLLSKLLPLALYPLGLALLLQLTGQIGQARQAARGHKCYWGRWLSGSGIALLWIFAMPLTARQLVWGLEERSAALTPKTIPRADAVVVLGGGLRPQLPPRRAVEVAEGGDRLLTGLRLLRQDRAPVLITSGAQVSFTAADPAPPEAFWARDLALELGAKPGQILVNPGSRTTAEEARDIGLLAKNRGWKRVLLVTSAFHMPRALATFQQRSGLTVIPVACDYQLPSRAFYGRPSPGNTLKSLLPDAEFLYLSTIALKEHIGLLTYKLKGWG